MKRYPCAKLAGMHFFYLKNSVKNLTQNEKTKEKLPIT